MENSRICGFVCGYLGAAVNARRLGYHGGYVSKLAATVNTESKVQNPQSVGTDKDGRTEQALPVQDETPKQQPMMVGDPVAYPQNAVVDPAKRPAPVIGKTGGEYEDRLKEFYGMRPDTWPERWRRWKKVRDSIRIMDRTLNPLPGVKAGIPASSSEGARENA